MRIGGGFGLCDGYRRRKEVFVFLFVCIDLIEKDIDEIMGDKARFKATFWACSVDGFSPMLPG